MVYITQLTRSAFVSIFNYLIDVSSCVHKEFFATILLHLTFFWIYFLSFLSFLINLAVYGL